MNKSFNILIAEHRSMVISYLQSLGADLHLAEDLAQETFLAAYKTLEKFETDKSFSSWLRGIARNKALMHWRSASTRPQLSMDSRSVEGINEVYDSYDRQNEAVESWGDRREMLQECIAKLNTSLRRAIERVYIQGDNLEEAATILNCTRMAVAQRLSRARNHIRKCVELKLKNKIN